MGPVVPVFSEPTHVFGCGQTAATEETKGSNLELRSTQPGKGMGSPGAVLA